MTEMKSKILTIIIILFITINSKSQASTLFIGATAHLGNGKAIYNAAISVKNGKFDLVADADMLKIDPSAFDTIYKIYNKYLI